MGLAREGRVYDLDCVRFPGMPLFPGHPPFQVMAYRTPRGLDNQGDQEWLAENDVKFAWQSEMVMGTVHSGTHIDALSHITCGDEHSWFGGGNAERDLGDFGPAARRRDRHPADHHAGCSAGRRRLPGRRRAAGPRPDRGRRAAVGSCCSGGFGCVLAMWCWCGWAT